MVILHGRRPPDECICSSPPLYLLLFSFVVMFFVSFPQLVSLSPLLLPPFLLPHRTYPPPSPLHAPFPFTHQSLALASPLRTYGMMDCRASGASKAKGHLLGARLCRGALGPAKQPRPRTSVSRHSHHMHTATPIMGWAT